MVEWNASDYSRNSSLQAAMAQERLSRLTLNGCERVLDISCGDGKVTAQIAAMVPHGSVLGVDASSQMIAFADQHHGPAVHPNLTFAVADVCQLAFHGEFDLVVSFNALHWVADQDTALRCIRRALKPAGQTLLQFVPLGPRKSLEAVIEETCLSPRWAHFFVDYVRPFAHFTLDEYRALAQRNGFAVIRIRREEKSWDFGTRAAFRGFAHGTFVEWTRRLPEGDRDAFITDVLDTYHSLIAEKPEEGNTFKFYQMEVVLTPAG
jgi:trans-aconitate 2-methyltransferase